MENATLAPIFIGLVPPFTAAKPVRSCPRQSRYKLPLTNLACVGTGSFHGLIVRVWLGDSFIGLLGGMKMTRRNAWLPEGAPSRHNVLTSPRNNILACND